MATAAAAKAPLDHTAPLTSTFSDRDENTHSVEFDAPNSAVPKIPSSPLSSAGSNDPAKPKHYSIDLSLELEHQLNMESPTVAQEQLPPLLAKAESSEPSHDALDPQILAHLVAQLRHSLGEMTKERDDLAKMLADSHAQQASLNDALQLMTEKATDLGEKLEESRKKIKEDEETISVLRTKVEESR